MAHSSLILESLDEFAAKMKSKSKSDSGSSMGNRYADHMFRCARRLLYRIALGLGWRSQLSHEPTVGLSGFHWIDQIDRNLMVVIALEALERPDIKAGWAGVHTCQHGCGLVLWTWRPVKRDHGALLKPGGSVSNAQSPADTDKGAVMKRAWSRRYRVAVQYCSLSRS
jgi:hypothetical protein